MVKSKFSMEGLQNIEEYFSKYVAKKQIAGCSMIIWSGGADQFTFFKGVQDLDTLRPIRRNTIFRIYSMTKPVASVALMLLCQRHLCNLEDPIESYLPKFSNMVLWQKDGSPVLAKGKITIRHLLTHTAGLILPTFSDHPLRDMYISQGINGSRSEGSLCHVMSKLAQIPLLFEPGTRWEYSMATDVVGCLIETISGCPLDEFLRKEIFEPLGMCDTGFYLPHKKISRFAGNYTRDGDGPIRPIDKPAVSRYLTVPQYKSGNGGLLSTMDDYLRFCLMLRNQGNLDGTSLLKPETVDMMTRNQLNGDMAGMGAANFGGLDWHGMGFGLGFSVVLDSKRVGYGNKGIYGWSGAASTYFWIDPVTDLVVIFFCQFMPSRAYDIRNNLRPLVYDALVLK